MNKFNPIISNIIPGWFILNRFHLVQEAKYIRKVKGILLYCFNISKYTYLLSLGLTNDYMSISFEFIALKRK